jgi:branched-chain amino acid aminotransferase
LGSDHPRPFAFSATGTVYRAEGRRGGDPEWEGDLQPFGSVAFSPAAAAFSYGLGVFEGLKAHRAPDGRVLLFRPRANAERFRRSAEQLLMLPFPADRFVAAVTGLVKSNLDHLPPHGEGALYLRPVELAVEPRLGIGPCREFCVLIYAAPVGPYFAPAKAGAGLRLRVLEQSRVPAGGSGGAKAMGNYAGCLRVVQRWRDEGYHDVLFLDARELRFVAETSGSNVFARLRDGRLVTPSLDDQILAGITRDSVIRLARDLLGLTVEERPLPIDEVVEEAEELFCTGTAYTVQSVAELQRGERLVRLPGRDTARELREALLGIQTGTRDDPFDWVMSVRAHS